jgi:hypothetical protein
VRRQGTQASARPVEADREVHEEKNGNIFYTTDLNGIGFHMPELQNHPLNLDKKVLGDLLR